MNSNETEKNAAPVNAHEADSRESGLGIGSRIAPAVALLLLGGSAYAQPDDLEDDSPVAVPEPSTLALLGAGAVIAGTARYFKNRRRNK